MNDIFSTQKLISDFVESEARKRKFALEEEKLKMENTHLRRQISWHGATLEWLKSATVIAAIIGILVSYYISSYQYQAAEEGRNSRSFDETLGRLSSGEVRGRLAGVLGIRPFLLGSNFERKSIALQVLVRALSVEGDKHVRSAIIEVLSGDEVKNAELDVLNNTLKTTVDRNRQLTTFVVRKSNEHIQGMIKKRLEKVRPGTNESDQISDNDMDALPFDEFLATLSYSRWPFDHFLDEDIPILEDMAKAITVLVSHKATYNYFSGIFCQGCNFSGADLSGVRFAGAYLAGADFTNSLLRHADFKDADLQGVSFLGANLYRADLRRIGETVIPIKRDPRPPIFECANLVDARLDNLIVMTVSRRLSRTDVKFSIPFVSHATFSAGTTFNPFGIAVTQIYSEKYFDDNPPQDAVEGNLRGQSVVRRNEIADLLTKNRYTMTLDYFNERSEVSRTMGSFGDKKRDIGYVQLTGINFADESWREALQEWTQPTLIAALIEAGWSAAPQLKKIVPKNGGTATAHESSGIERDVYCSEVLPRDLSKFILTKTSQRVSP